MTKWIMLLFVLLVVMLIIWGDKLLEDTPLSSSLFQKYLERRG